MRVYHWVCHASAGQSIAILGRTLSVFSVTWFKKIKGLPRPVNYKAFLEDKVWNCKQAGCLMGSIIDTCFFGGCLAGSKSDMFLCWMPYWQHHWHVFVLNQLNALWAASVMMTCFCAECLTGSISDRLLCRMPYGPHHWHVFVPNALWAASVTGVCAVCQPGKGVLRLKFTGQLNDKMKGFYRSKYTTPDGQERFAAVTQFEVCVVLCVCVCVCVFT